MSVELNNFNSLHHLDTLMSVMPNVIDARRNIEAAIAKMKDSLAGMDKNNRWRTQLSIAFFTDALHHLPEPELVAANHAAAAAEAKS